MAAVGPKFWGERKLVMVCLVVWFSTNGLCMEIYQVINLLILKIQKFYIEIYFESVILKFIKFFKF